MPFSFIDHLSTYPFIAYPILLAIMSAATFLVYGWDKRQAKIRGWRISEKQLHTMAFLGGWPGAMLGRRYFRHKTQKAEFSVMIGTAAASHAILIGSYLYSNFTG